MVTVIETKYNNSAHESFNDVDDLLKRVTTFSCKKKKRKKKIGFLANSRNRANAFMAFTQRVIFWIPVYVDA